MKITLIWTVLILFRIWFYTVPNNCSDGQLDLFLSQLFLRHYVNDILIKFVLNKQFFLIIYSSFHMDKNVFTFIFI